MPRVPPPNSLGAASPSCEPKSDLQPHPEPQSGSVQVRTLVGAVAGAVPPLIGAAAACGRLDPTAWVLLWQFPHFMATSAGNSPADVKEMPFAQAALLGCGVVTGAGSVLNTANVRTGDSVVIFGAGGVGLNAVSGARIAGASRIIAIDIQQKRLDAARRFGATDVIDSTKSKPVEAVRDLLPGGADHVFDFVGLKLVAEEGLAMLGVGGGLYLVGVSKPDVDISLNIFGAIGGQKRVVGVNFGSTNAKRDIPMYAQLYLQGRMNLDDLVSKEIPLREVNDGYAALKDGSLNRVVVTSF